MQAMKPWLMASLGASLWTASGTWAAINPNLPPEESEGAIAYMSGGIDSNQALAMQHAASKYSLELEFLLPGDTHEVPAYVPVTIKDTAGDLILDRASDGPLMLVQLPDGRYTITAQISGKAETVDVSLAPGQHKTLAFDWKTRHDK